MPASKLYVKLVCDVGWLSMKSAVWLIPAVFDGIKVSRALSWPIWLVDILSQQTAYGAITNYIQEHCDAESGRGLPWTVKNTKSLSTHFCSLSSWINLQSECIGLAQTMENSPTPRSSLSSDHSVHFRSILPLSLYDIFFISLILLSPFCFSDLWSHSPVRS